METKYFKNCENEQSLRDRAQLLKGILLLDDPGNKNLRVEVEAEYHSLLKQFKSSAPVVGDAKEPSQEEIITALLPLKLRLEVCGKWLWIRGDTRPHRDFLKKLRCRYSPGKKCWYWRPGKFKSINTDPLDMDEIRNLYGSNVLS